MTRRRDDERPREERDVVLGRALEELDAPDYPPDFLASVWARVDAGDGAAATPAPELGGEERDAALGRVLEELDAPDYPPDFLASVWARVDAEEEATRMTAPEEAVSETTESATGGARLRRPRRSRSFWRLHPVLAPAAAVAIAAAVAAAVLIGLPGISRVSGPQPVSAAQVIQKALQALSSGETLQADVTMKWATALLPGGVPEYDVVRSRLLMRADGSFHRTRTKEPAKPEEPAWGLGVLPIDPNDIEAAYDAATGVGRSYYLSSEAPGLRVDVTKGLPLGPPDVWPNFAADLGAVALALQASGRATLETTSYEGRPVWVISLSGGLAGPLSVDPEETALITIDQQTSLPTRYQAVQDGVLKLEIAWRNMRINEPLPDGIFTFALPKGVKVFKDDAGFRRLPLARIASAKRYVTLLPSWLPAGYVRGLSAAAAKSETPNGLVQGRHEVAAQYTRGFDVLTITTRKVRDPQNAVANDPFDVEPQWGNLVGRDVRLSAGSFAGVTARVVVAPRITIPHLYAVKDDVLLTIAGGASAEELVSIAESLQPYRPRAALSPSAP